MNSSLRWELRLDNLFYKLLIGKMRGFALAGKKGKIGRIFLLRLLTSQKDKERSIKFFNGN